MSDAAPELEVQPAPRRGASAVSLVWLIPIAALLVALTIAVTTYRERGPIIQIAFSDAAGILPKETELRFRNVSVGLVERVAFNEDLTRVLVDVRLDKNVAPFVDEDAEFWIVQPEVTTSGVRGLQTVLSGVYIAGSWDMEAGTGVTAFQGLPQAPLSTAYRTGTIIELRSSRDTGLTENTPILFKGIEVGRTGTARIAQNGQAVFADAIIYEPHNRLVSTATRFWDTSGVSFSLGPAGARLDFSSLASLVAGGITFDTLVSGGEPLREGLSFDVFPNQSAARASVFEDNAGGRLNLTMIFEENVSGLATEAVVEWRGLRIGEVVAVTGIVDPERFGDGRVRLLTNVEIRPSRFGLGQTVTRSEALEFLGARVAEGLRARLTTASLLAGGLKVELVTVEEAEEATFDLSGDPFPVFPVTASFIREGAGSAEGFLQRISALPIEDLLDATIGFLDNATALVASEDLRETPGAILGLVTDARGVIGSEAVQALPADIRVLLADLRAASGDLRDVLADLREADAAARLVAAVDQVSAAAEAFETAVQGIPDLTDRITAFVARADGLALEDFASEATALATEARVFFSSDALGALPAQIAAPAAELSTLLSALNEAETAAALNAALQETGATAETLSAAASGVPQLVARFDRIAARAEEVQLAELAEELGSVLDAASALFGDASEADLPDAMAVALREMRAALAEMREGGLVESANATLGSARSAAAAIESVAEDLPALVTRMNATLAAAEETLSDFDSESSFGRQTASALREVERAADAVADLARAIERRPNSILIGR